MTQRLSALVLLTIARAEIGGNGTVHCPVSKNGDSQLSPVVLVLAVLLACSVTVIVALIVYINQTVFQHFKGTNKGPSRPHKSSRNRPSDTDADANKANYVALNFPTKKTKGMKKKTESPPDCVYSAVRAGLPTLHEMS
ncbi:hypothetical protein XENOCAPTIV_019705 [Xenoophorus captivus]|uniref:Uncharacterized protein n=1 Tax=Xenoophorus captivus TaxID=1517983 RepID=A0ABV0R172_9TELE